MLSLGALAFASPWFLLGLPLLPLLYWLLRVTPPAPARVSFPAVRLLLGLRPQEETPARTPLWLVLLRIAIAALIILALARPLLNPSGLGSGSGPLLLVIDNGWTAARQWSSHVDEAERILVQAERSGRPVYLLTTAAADPGVGEPSLEPLPAGQVRSRVSGLQPRPWAVDHLAAAARLETLDQGTQSIWLSDGLEHEGTQALVQRLLDIGRVTIFREEGTDLPRMVVAPESEGLVLRPTATRAEAGPQESATLLISGAGGDPIGALEVVFPDGETEAVGELRLPADLRNRISSIALEGESGAAARYLLDEAWRRRSVGIVAPGGSEAPQPLLSEVYYLQRALEPFNDMLRGDVEELLEQELSVVLLPDGGQLDQARLSALEDWAEAGGMLIRFAGPALAEEADDLVPVQLRGGGRTLGGALTWDTPAQLSPFEDGSPFGGLPVTEEVAVTRQVLAEPTLDLPERTWAKLTDGTPIVTAEPRGDGWLVLFHTSANTDWSNLPLSGLFVEMLRRLVDLSQGVASIEEGGPPLVPLQVMDGFGRLAPASPAVLPIAPEDLAAGLFSPEHPPGLYGEEGASRALNIGDAESALLPLGPLPARVQEERYRHTAETDLFGWLLLAALLIGLADFVLGLRLRGLGWRPSSSAGPGPASATTALCLLALPLLAVALWPSSVKAADEDIVEALRETRFAYVITGIPALDRMSEAGLTGLSRLLRQRTAIEPGDPQGVRLGRDELAFYPLLYWPISPEQRDLDSAAREALNEYLLYGGTILIDLREQSAAGRGLLGDRSQNGQALRRLTAGIDVPPLSPVPPDHVMTKAFYLLQDFPGRFDGGSLWVESPDRADNDGVASVIIGSNDWASAWAVDEYGIPLAAVVPGGERQREMAYRFGVNLAMYALTGNYKADQVHVPFILERLGQ